MVVPHRDHHAWDGSELEAMKAASEVQLSTSGRLGSSASSWVTTQSKLGSGCRRACSPARLSHLGTPQFHPISLALDPEGI